MTTVHQHLGFRPRSLPRSVSKPGYLMIFHHDQEIDVAPFVGGASSKRSDQGGARHGCVGPEQAEQVLQKFVAFPTQPPGISPHGVEYPQPAEQRLSN